MFNQMLTFMHRHRPVALVAIAAVSLAACGSSSSKSSIGRTTGSTKRTVTASLPHPLMATCLPKSAAKPVIARFDQPVGQTQLLAGWRVIYKLSPTISSLNQTALVTLLEMPPVLPAGYVKGGQFRTVAGRTVSFLVRPGPAYGFVARWKTPKALYLALANGRQPEVFERVIGCMP